MTDDKSEMHETKTLIIDEYKSIVELKRELPSYREFLLRDIKRDSIRRHFGGIEFLHEYMRENENSFLSRFFSSVDNIFSETRSAARSSKKTFVITTAVADSKAHKGFLDSLSSYCEKKDAQLVIMPCESVTNSFENKTAVFDPIFNDEKYLFVQDDTKLNDNISLCSIQVSAKQIKPITGLQRLGTREGSYIFASPKQFLEYVPAGNSRENNFTIMTPGACTMPQYFTETFVSKRLSYIAKNDHTLGAVIVELEDDRRFDFRQIQASDDGSFIDLGMVYNPDGTTEKTEVNIVFGDLHGIHAEDTAIEYFTEMFSGYDVKSIFLHDVFDGYSVSHHVKDIAERANRYDLEKSSLRDELRYTHELIEGISKSLNPKTVYIVKSNHDEFLDRYLSEGRYVSDPTNHLISLKIATALFDETDVLQKGFEVSGFEIPENWKFLSRSYSVKIDDVECAAHGDLGLNGAKASLNSLEKIYGNCVTAHNHTAAIQRGVFRVGTLSKLDMRYNRGPSSWTHTCCLVYENGQRQLINYIP